MTDLLVTVFALTAPLTVTFSYFWWHHNNATQD